VVWRILKPFAIAFNAGKGFRAPSEFELFANGVHEGTGKFENGNPLLRPEYSENVDVSLRYATASTKAELTVFRNQIRNFIYSVNTGTIDAGSGLFKFAYRQDRALLVGAELSVEQEIRKWLVLLGGFDTVTGTYYPTLNGQNINQTNLTTNLNGFAYSLLARYGTPLPNMPADRARLGVKLTTENLDFLSNPYIKFEGRFAAGQYRVSPLEAPSHPYNLYDFSFGTEIASIAAGPDKATLDFAILNLTNKAYVDHDSRYGTYALNPAIDAQFKITIPITLIKGGPRP